jgi:PAS domain S-box-containing protein
LCGEVGEICKLGGERKTFQKIVETPVKILGLESSLLILTDKFDRTLYCVASSKGRRSRAPHRTIPEDCFENARAALRQGRTIVTPPARTGGRPGSSTGRPPARQATAYIPLLSRRMAFGVLILRARPGCTLKRDELELATHFSSLAAVAIENAKLLSRLAETEGRFRSLIEHIPAIIYTCEVEPPFRILYISPQVEQILGWTVRDISDKPGFLTTRIHPEDLERLIDYTAEVVRKRGFASTEFRSKDRWGEYRWFRDEAVLIRDPSGEPLAWHGVVVEITGLKKSLDRAGINMSRPKVDPSPVHPDS